MLSVGIHITLTSLFLLALAGGIQGAFETCQGTQRHLPELEAIPLLSSSNWLGFRQNLSNFCSG